MKTFLAVPACHWPVLYGFDQLIYFYLCPPSPLAVQTQQHREFSYKELWSFDLNPGQLGPEASMLSAMLC